MEPLSRRERAALAETLTRVGPDAPTLCEGWTARDLVAHLVTRERRPDAAIGLVVRALSERLDRIQHRYADRPFDRLVDDFRSGPPLLSPFALPPVERLANAVEHFVHHEDVRRAQPAWAPRPLSEEDEALLWARLKPVAPALLRRAGAQVTLRTPDGRTLEGGSGEGAVTVTGPPSELLLFTYGRQAQAQVEVEGDVEAVRLVRDASLGF